MFQVIERLMFGNGQPGPPVIDFYSILHFFLSYFTLETTIHSLVHTIDARF